MKQSLPPLVLVVTLFMLSLSTGDGFIPRSCAARPQRLRHPAKLDAKKKPNKASGGGFGKSAATKTPTVCPCGASSASYDECTCSGLHSLLVASKKEPCLSPSYEECGPVEIVRSRFTAYALKNVDWIIKTTSKENPQHYVSDYKQWKEALERDCYDSFNLLSCDILGTTWEKEKEYREGDTVTVEFCAKMRQKGDREDVSMTEVSSFKRERIGDGKEVGWLYSYGDVK